MDRHVLPTFSGRILPIDTAVAQRCAMLHVPNPRSDRDALIAATALVRGLMVATRNVAGFERMGVEGLVCFRAEGKGRSEEIISIRRGCRGVTPISRYQRRIMHRRH